MNTTRTWKQALRTLLEHGLTVSPLSAGAAWRGRANRELRAFQTVIPMRTPVLLSKSRKLGFRFLTAEAAWICSGDNKVSTIAPYAKAISSLSDDGQRFFGAYGPKFIEQLSFVVETLIKDPASRQAVIQIWREQPRTTKDTPCTLSWQFLLRDGELHCVATMRSSDIWTGWVYDVFNFSMVSAIVALELRQQAKVFLTGATSMPVSYGTSVEEVTARLEMIETIQLGNLYLTAGSQHLYEMDVDGAQACLQEADPEFMTQLNLADFKNAEHLIHHLWSCAKGEWHLEKNNFLKELFQ